MKLTALEMSNDCTYYEFELSFLPLKSLNSFMMFMGTVQWFNSLTLVFFLMVQLSVSMRFEGSNMANSSSETKTTLRYTENEQNQHIEEATKSYPTEEQTDGNVGMDGSSSPAESVIPPKRAAKIHDFCFGIPFGMSALST